jgi:hypothetical protein
MAVQDMQKAAPTCRPVTIEVAKNENDTVQETPMVGDNVSVKRLKEEQQEEMSLAEAQAICLAILLSIVPLPIGFCIFRQPKPLLVYCFFKMSLHLLAALLYPLYYRIDRLAEMFQSDAISDETVCTVLMITCVVCSICGAAYGYLARYYAKKIPDLDDSWEVASV